MILLGLLAQVWVASTYPGERNAFGRATLADRLDRLATAGLIERRANLDDRRAILACLTNPGRRWPIIYKI